MFVLESLESAIRRKTPIYAEVTGFAATQEVGASSHYGDPGSYSAAIDKVLRSNGPTSLDIDLIVPGGSGVLSEDNFELQELRRVFGDRLTETSMLLPKPRIGDPGAGNVIGAAAAVLAIRQGHVHSVAKSRSVNRALCCSCSENGQNAAILFKTFEL